MSTTTTVIVTGMTCGHCVTSVREEIGAIAGVSDVQVDLATGAVTITGERSVETAAIKAAVEEAGYELAS